MKRVIAAALLVAAAVLAVAVNSSAARVPHHPAGKTITGWSNTWHTHAVTNGDPNNDVVGNILTFGNDVFDAADTPQGRYRPRILYPHRRGQLLGVHVDDVSPIRPDHRWKARSSPTVTRCLRSLAGRARTATLAAIWSSNTTIRKGRSSTSSSM